MSKPEVKLLAEFSLPAMALGVVAALGAGVLALVAGQPAGWAVTSGLALGVPIALLGAVYSSLVALKKVPTGVFTPAAAFWLVGFPLSMLVFEVVSQWQVTGTPGLPQEPLWQFLAYNALLSMGFAIGFLWSHEYLGRQWWPRIQDRNPYAASTVAEHIEHAVAINERSAEAARARREKKARKAQAQAVAKRS